MPTDDLSDLSGLDDAQRALLAEKLDITNGYELIMADRRRVVRAFGRRRNRPTLEDVSVWQDEARRVRAAVIDASATAIAASGWEPVATFVVAFEERRRGKTRQRRVVAEQTEIEPESAPHHRSQWPDWTSDDVCRWMAERVGVAAVSDTPDASQVASVEQVPTAGNRPPGRPSRIDIERVTLVDSIGHIELVAASHPVPPDRLVWVQPTRLVVILGVAPTETVTSLVLQLVMAGAEEQIIVGHVDDVRQVAEIELSGLTGGEYTPTLVVRTPGGSSLPRVVKLPTVVVVASAIGPS